MTHKEIRRSIAMMACLTAQAAMAQTPLLSSWQTQYSNGYARVVQTTGGTAVTTWPSAGLTNMGGGQSVPAYADIQKVDYSTSWVYVKATGLASHQMGPWYNATGAIFGNWPSNQKRIHRFPTVPNVPATKTTNGLGPLGLWVNGVALFNLLDGFSYNTAQAREVNGTNNIWVRNAVVVESPTFDKSNAHQPGNGQYHYHDNPLALRLQLNDNLTGNMSTGVYSESTTNLHHSPILGYANDGFPIYGPYGYSDPLNPNSGVRRIKSGFVLRNGSYGTVNLTTAGRHSLGQWAATLHGVSTTLATNQYGPNVSATYTLGRYVEDFDYLGNLGYTAGPSTFDLDIYNGRFCQTPEYPFGTYAYFVTIDASGAPAFPYVLGRQYYGSPTGNSVTSISETVTSYVNAGPNTPISGDYQYDGSKLWIKWISIEGGVYRVEGQLANGTWATIASNVSSGGRITTYTSMVANAKYKGFRAILTSTNAYDSF